MAALDNIASELLKSANEADLIYKRTRDQAQRDKAVRLRRIVENLKAISAGGLTPTLDEVLTEGNVSTNTLNVGGITSDYFQLDTTATPTLAPGMFAWNDAYGTADLRLKGNNVTLQLGQEILARVVNKTGADLLESDYKVVRVRIASEGGAQGQRLAVVLAQGDNDPDSATTLGVVTETILNNQEGFITILGNVNNIDTTGTLQGETWVDGDVLYLSPTIPGAITKVKPVAPQHTVIIGYVVYAHNNQGKIFVKVDNGYELDELHNVLITSPANNDLLQYDSTQQVWKNVAPSIAVPTPTLAQVTTAGNTTTNSIIVGATQYKYLGVVVGEIRGNANTYNNFDLVYGASWNGSQWIDELGAYGSNKLTLGNDGIVFYTGSNQASGFPVNYTERMRMAGTGNVLIGTTTDAGYKLDVNGTLRTTSTIRVGSTFNGTLATLADFRGAGDSDFVQIARETETSRGVKIYASGMIIASSIETSGAAYSFLNNTSGAATTGTRLFFNVTGGWAPTSGTASWDQVRLNPTINTTGTYSGIVRGIYYKPTLTSLTGTDHRAIETTAGNVVFNGGNVGIGTSSPAKPLHVSTNNNDTTMGVRVSNDNVGGRAGLSFNLPNNTNEYYSIGIDSDRLFKIANSGTLITNTRMSFTPNGNVLIGTTTDAGYKLDVNGTARVLSSSEAVFRVEHTNGNYVTTVLGNGSALAAGQVGMYLNGSGIWSASSNFFKTFSNNIRGQSSSQIFTVIGGYGASNIGNSIRLQSNTWDLGAFTATSGTQNTVLISGGQNERWQPSSGNATYNSLVVLPIINTTGTYAGIVRGIFYNPTLTSVTGTTHRAIETVTGDVIFGSTSGNVAIGTNSPTTYMTEQRILAISGGPGTQISMVGSRTTNDILGAFAFWNNTNRVADINSIRYNNDTSGAIRFRVADSGSLSEAARIVSNGNVLIGTTTDAGERLQVTGDVRITNGRYKLGGSQVGLYATTDLGLTVNTGSGNSFLGYYATGGTSYLGTTVTLGRLSSVNLNAVSDLQEMVRITGNYAPTSGTGLFTALQLSNTINQTGGANGITRGLYINPTLTSAFDYRAIETTAGNVVFNGGNVGIGTSNPLYKLHVTDSAGDIVYILASTGQSAIIGATGSGTNRMYIGYSPGAENISITSSGVVRLNSITSGNVLIGTTTDAGYKLDVAGTARVTDNAFFNKNIAVGSTTGGTDNLISLLGPSNGFFRVRSVSGAVYLGLGDTLNGSQGNMFGLTRAYLNEYGNTVNGIMSTDNIPYSIRFGAFGSSTEALRITTSQITSYLKFVTTGSITAASALAQGVYFNNTLVAAANNDVLVGLDINPTFTNGAFTGVSNIGLRVQSGKTIFGSTTQGQPSEHYFESAGTNPILVVRGITPSSSDIQRWYNNNNLLAYLNASGDFYAGRLRVSSSGPSYPGISFRSDSSAGIGYTSGITVITNNTERLRVFNTTGNVGINTTTDAGYKLDVNGSVRAQGGVYVPEGQRIEWATSREYLVGNGGRATMTLNQGGNGLGYSLFIVASGFSQTSGTGGVLSYSPTINPTSGTAVFNLTNIAPTINQTGGANGITRGLYINPTITAAADFRAIETTSGNVIFNGGNVGIGTTTPTDKFHIVDNTNGNKFARISAGGTDASAAWVAQNDQVDNVVYRVFGSAVTGSQMGQALARSASLIANLGGTGKFLIGSFSGTDLIFGTSDQARMRLVDATGNFLIGTMTDTGNKLTVSGDIDAQGYKVNNVLGYTGILNIPTNPPGQQNIDIQGGIVINIF